MARYIDADRLLTKIHELYVQPNIELWQVVKCVGNSPTADVAPKSEVERLTIELDAMRGAANSYKMHYEVARQEIEKLKDQNTGVVFKHYFDGRKEVAREIFEEIEGLLKIVKLPCFDAEGYIKPMRAGYWAIDPNDYAELKKKYTGDE